MLTSRHYLGILIVLATLALACNMSVSVEPPGTEPAGTGPPVVKRTPAPSISPTDGPQPLPTGTVPPTVLPPPLPTDTLPTEPPPPTAPPTVSLPPTLEPVPPGYTVEEEQQVGPYTIQVWRNTAGTSMFDAIATISDQTQMVARDEFVSQLGDVTGTDVTGEGNPDVIVEIYTGGAHCCFSTVIYDLGPTLTEVFRSPESNCGGILEDIDGDGIYEFSTCDDSFAYVYCPYAGSPAAPVVLQYRPGQGYAGATHLFADLYADTIPDLTERARQATPGGMGEWDDTTKCGVLPLVLTQLYTGRADQAWESLETYYTYPDLYLFWAEIFESVSSGSMYTPSGPDAQVLLPENYMLQLLTGCGPDRQVVGVLSEGMDPCDAQTPTRDLLWLGLRLQEAGLIGDGERIRLAPEDCTMDCRLDVTTYADETRLGSIRLDTTVGFPGEVYRVNGTESSHYRLRGDLTWEQVTP